MREVSTVLKAEETAEVPIPPKRIVVEITMEPAHLVGAVPAARSMAAITAVKPLSQHTHGPDSQHKNHQYC